MTEAAIPRRGDAVMHKRTGTTLYVHAVRIHEGVKHVVFATVKPDASCSVLQTRTLEEWIEKTGPIPAPTEVRWGLTLWRPWPAIMLPPGPKTIENRPWEPPPWVIGKRIAIHAGEKFDEPGWLNAQRILERCGQADLILGIAERMGTKGIVGTAIVAGCMKPIDDDDPPWLFGPFGWVLEDLQALQVAVPCKGAQKLWAIPAAERALVDAQL